MTVAQTTKHSPEITGKPVRVTRAQVLAAKGKIETDRRQGKETPKWVRAVAAAKPAR